jgi:hypothetical protein
MKNKGIIKKLFKFVVVIVLVCVIAGVAFAAGRDTVVYITKTGEKYHTEGCSSVRSSKIAITLGEAVSRRFEPCQLCRPPVLDAD